MSNQICRHRSGQFVNSSCPLPRTLKSAAKGRAVHREYGGSWSDRCLSVTTVTSSIGLRHTFLLTGHYDGKNLNDLVAFLDSLQARAPLQELVAELAELRVGCDELREHVRFSDKQYARNLVCKGPWYHLLVLCWKNGQRSPIHDHAGLGLRGPRASRHVTETTFDFAQRPRQGDRFPRSGRRRSLRHAGR